jgi:hypothetical protein
VLWLLSTLILIKVDSNYSCFKSAYYIFEPTQYNYTMSIHTNIQNSSIVRTSSRSSMYREMPGLLYEKILHLIKDIGPTHHSRRPCIVLLSICRHLSNYLDTQWFRNWSQEMRTMRLGAKHGHCSSGYFRPISFLNTCS